jgi:peptidoglycan/xylan/chitin deacetylase (PgdA/CDA1 family)
MASPPLEHEIFEAHPIKWCRGGTVLPRPELIARVSGPQGPLVEHARGLPAGPAGAEALAVRLRRLGATVRGGEAEVVETPAALLRSYREWGRGSVVVFRRDPSLVPELAVGGWFEADAARRAARRLALPLGRIPLVLRRPGAGAADVAFWNGVRAEATVGEWRRLTRGYTALLYHRLAGDLKRGQERLDVSPRKFDEQMRLLRLLRFVPLSSADLAAFHAAARTPRRRCVAITCDDAFEDVVEALLRHAALHPLLFVPTSDVGRRAGWLGGERLATWAQLRELAGAGVELGAHSRTHADLVAADDATAEREILGAGEDLRAKTDVSPAAFAYPHGRFDGRARELVRAAGYALAFTTRTGRNGAGTDVYALRRVSVKAWDSRLSFAWKLFTGEQPPPVWERWLLVRAGIARRLARALPSARAHGRAPAMPSAEPPPRPRP